MKSFRDDNDRTVWLQAEAFANDSAGQQEQLLHSLAHEVGHVMMGGGHPNQNKGPASLHGSATHERLMHSATYRYPEGRRELLVKKEGDKIEIWLIDEETEGRITQ